MIQKTKALNSWNHPSLPLKAKPSSRGAHPGIGAGQRFFGWVDFFAAKERERIHP
jgi:hypothetical protein